MGLKICTSDKHHRYYKHTKFRQNLRGDPKFLVDSSIEMLYEYIIIHVVGVIGTSHEQSR